MNFILKWRAVYKDESYFESHDQNGNEIKNAYPQIDRKNLKRFELYTLENRLIARLYIPNSKYRLIFRRRPQANAFTGEIKQIIYCMSWEKTRFFFFKSRLIMYIFDDWHTEYFSKWGSKEPYRKINVWDFEKVVY